MSNFEIIEGKKIKAILRAAFQIFYSGQGSQGILGAPSKQQLDNCFNTHNDVEVIKAILEKGKEQSVDAVRHGFNSTNATRGTTVMDNKGRGNVIGGV